MYSITFSYDEKGFLCCGTVGRAVASDPTDLQFESSHPQILASVYSIDKTKIKEKEAGNGPFKKGFNVKMCKT